MIVETVGCRDFGIDIEEDSLGKGGYWLIARTADRSGGISWEQELKWHRSLDAARNSAVKMYDRMTREGNR